MGVTNGVAAYRWAKALGENVQVAFPGTDLATRRADGRWSPTEAGLQAHQRLHALGVRAHHVRGRWLRLEDLAAASEGSLERAYELVAQWTEVARLLPCGPPTPLICEAMDWVGFGISIEEAKEWAQVARVPMTKVCAWREQGFTPFGASLWYQHDLEAEEDKKYWCFGPYTRPTLARELHLALYGEDNGLGPKRKGRVGYTWRPPLTPQQQRARRRARRRQWWGALLWALRGRPGCCRMQCSDCGLRALLKNARLKS